MSKFNWLLKAFINLTLTYYTLQITIYQTSKNCIFLHVTVCKHDAVQ